jgi:hypothetical protein
MAKKEVGLQKAQLLFLESSPSFSVRTLMNIAAQTRQPVRLGADALLSPSPESLLPLLRTFSSTREWDTVMSILAREGLLTWFDSSLILR